MSANPNEPLPAVLVSDLLEEDPDLIDLVEEFVAGLSKRVAEFRAAHAAADWRQLQVLAHQLKGAGGSYGYARISTLGATMESEFKQHAAADFEQQLATLEQMIAAAKAGLNQT